MFTDGLLSGRVCRVPRAARFRGLGFRAISFFWRVATLSDILSLEYEPISLNLSECGVLRLRAEVSSGSKLQVSGLQLFRPSA